MFNLFRKNKFTIEQTPSGKFAIVHTRDGILKTYTRKRDAVRGATRMGISLSV
jgi:hypothetical protein